MNTQYKQLTATDRKQGFTIIEVVLVLAIAGLIFLMVFLALPALQKGQRDTQRREDLSRISTQINSYSSNARGKIPDTGNLSNFVENYLGGDQVTAANTAGPEYTDPSGNETDPDAGYVIAYNDATTVNATVGTVYYGAGVTCDDDNPGQVVAGKARNYALRVALENQSTPYCIDNR